MSRTTWPTFLLTRTAEYISTNIILNEADSSFGNTLALNEVTSSGLTTPDGGKTWIVDEIKIQQHTFDVSV